MANQASIYDLFHLKAAFALYIYSVRMSEFFVKLTTELKFFAYDPTSLLFVRNHCIILCFNSGDIQLGKEASNITEQALCSM